MNVSEPKNNLQLPSSPVVRFLEILTNVEERVSSHKVTSQELIFTQGRGSIDKLEIILPEEMFVTRLTERCIEIGYSVTGVRKADRRFYLTISNGPFIIDCYLGVPTRRQFNKVILNPSKAPNYFMVESELIKIFGTNVLASKIFRLDFTVDIFENYQKVLEGLDIKFKRSNVEFIGDSRTGLKIGTRNDKVVIYDKGLKEKSAQPWTRIERQMTGPTIFIKDFGRLRDSLSNILEFNPLGIISLSNVLAIESMDYSTIQSKRLMELKVLIKHEGYFLAKRKLSENNNFKRDYDSLLTITPYSKQPFDFFKRDIELFFKR